MTQEIPYLPSKQLRTLNSEQISKLRTQLGEITFDEVVQLNIIREKIEARSTHLAVADRLVVTRLAGLRSSNLCNR